MDIGKQLAAIAGAGVLLLGGLLLPASAQEKPLTINGEITTGVYSLRTGDGHSVGRLTTPFSLRMDATGYLGHPDFLSYTAHPQWSLGGQAPEGGFRDGDGVEVSANFVRKRFFPLTISYRNIKRDFLSYAGTAGGDTFGTQTHERDFMANGTLKTRRLPPIYLEFQRLFSDSTPTAFREAFVPKTQGRTTRYGLRTNGRRAGWDYGVSFSRDRTLRTIDILNPGFVPDFRSDTGTTQSELTAHRQVWGKHVLYLDGGSTDNQSKIQSYSYRYQRKYALTGMEFRGSNRWSGSVNAHYYDLGLIQGGLDRLAGTGSTASPARSDLRTGESRVDLQGSLSYRIASGLSLFGGLSKGIVRPSGFSGALGRLNSYGFTGGVSFTRSFSLGDFSADYAFAATRGQGLRDLTNSNPAARGQNPGDTSNHNLNARVRTGRLEKVELTGTFRTSRLQAEGFYLLASNNTSVDFSAGRRMSWLVLRGTLGLSRGFVQANTKNSNDETNVGIQMEHRRVQLRYERRRYHSLIFVPLELGVGGDGTIGQPPIGIPLIFPPTSFGGHSASVNITPWKSFFARASWFRGTQQLASQFNARLGSVHASAGYRFRLLDFEAGYDSYTQSFLESIGRTQARFFLRVSRSFKVL